MLLAAGALAEAVLAPMNETAERIGAAVVGVVLFASSLAVCAKRWHDRSKSAWWSLIGFVPAVGALWLIIELGFLDGTRGRNRFGPDPDH